MRLCTIQARASVVIQKGYVTFDLYMPVACSRPVYEPLLRNATLPGQRMAP